MIKVTKEYIDSIYKLSSKETEIECALKYMISLNDNSEFNYQNFGSSYLFKVKPNDDIKKLMFNYGKEVNKNSCKNKISIITSDDTPRYNEGYNNMVKILTKKVDFK